MRIKRDASSCPSGGPSDPSGRGDPDDPYTMTCSFQHTDGYPPSEFREAIALDFDFDFDFARHVPQTTHCRIEVAGFA